MTLNQATQLNSPIYEFPKGIPGFEQLKQFELKEHNELFSLLTAVDQPEITFILVSPFDVIPDYEFVLPDEVKEDLRIEDREQVAVRCIVTWHSTRSKTTVNLLAPLIFNTEYRQGKQIILQNSEYTTKHLLWGEDNNPGEEGDS